MKECAEETKQERCSEGKTTSTTTVRAKKLFRKRIIRLARAAREMEEGLKREGGAMQMGLYKHERGA